MLDLLDLYQVKNGIGVIEKVKMLSDEYLINLRLFLHLVLKAELVDIQVIEHLLMLVDGFLIWKINSLTDSVIKMIEKKHMLLTE
jgi:hypothetical protein